MSHNKELFLTEIADIIEKYKDIESADDKLGYQNEGIIRALTSEIQNLSQKIRDTYESGIDSKSIELGSFDIVVHFETAIISELNRVVEETESCANTILDLSENINHAILESTEPEFQEKTIALMTKLFEACNFQDFAFQRIQKVRGIILDSEDRILKICDTHKNLSSVLDESLKSLDAIAIRTNELLEKSKQVRTTTDDADLMNGPQIDPPSQNEIDSLFDDL